jgi:hypothetical protein
MDAGFEMKNPSSDPNDKFNNEFHADIEKVLKTIIYRVMIINCNKFLKHFGLESKCVCLEPPRGGLKKRKSKKRRKSIKKNNMKRKTKRRITQRKGK